MTQKKWLEHLYPGYFAMTMATGIISLALKQQNHTTLSEILFIFALFTEIC
jgi:tellurite resistance protein TehA-like permease